MDRYLHVSLDNHQMRRLVTPKTITKMKTIVNAQKGHTAAAKNTGEISPVPAKTATSRRLTKVLTRQTTGILHSKTDILHSETEILHSTRPITTVTRPITTVIRENTTVTRDITTVIRENTTVTRDITTVMRENTTVMEENTTVMSENTTVTREITRGRSLVLPVISFKNLKIHEESCKTNRVETPLAVAPTHAPATRQQTRPALSEM
jgi:hypothetical protein